MVCNLLYDDGPWEGWATGWAQEWKQLVTNPAIGHETVSGFLVSIKMGNELRIILPEAMGGVWEQIRHKHRSVVDPAGGSGYK